ncbi:MAG: dimethyl sulfoxide reductase anchor subunit [Eggerthellaceae bacterium]|nr:dimethyl sulfoxide reductase anchor subunit [Eggerthellaceae bacterium]
MELQWPLIIFTTLIAWSAGLFASQCLVAAAGKGEGTKAQLPAWICAAVLLAVGGIAVFFHLEHWERIFNGFGHVTSGITQELICIVILAIVAIVYLVLMMRDADKKPNKVVAWIGVVVSVILVLVTAHSYTMAARPAWDSVLWLLYMLGNACVLGPCTMAIIMAATDKDADLGFVGMLAVIGSAVATVTAVAYGAILQAVEGSFTSVGYYFDPTHPTAGMADLSSTVADQAMLVWLGAVIVGAVAPLLCAIFAKKQPKMWMTLGIVAVICAIIGAVCMRIAFYNLGISVFMFY